MVWLVGLVAFLCGAALGVVVRRSWLVTHYDRAVDGATAGTAVLMHGDVAVSRRRVKAPQYEQLRHHGRGKPDAYVYVGRNDAGEYVYQLVTD